jgi:hypothetical protein
MITIEGGAFQAPDGTPLANGTLTLSLSWDSTEAVSTPAGTVLSGIPIIITLDSSGNAPPTEIWSNAELNIPTYYTVQLFDSNGVPVLRTPIIWNFSAGAGAPIQITSGPGPTLSFPNPVTIGDLLICCSMGGPTAPDLPTDTIGNTWYEVSTGAKSAGTGAAQRYIRMFYCITKSSGSDTVTSVNALYMTLAEITGIQSTMPVQDASAGVSNITTPTGTDNVYCNLTITTADFIWVFGYGITGTLSVGTNLDWDWPSAGWNVEYINETVAQTVACDMTDSLAGDQAAIIAAGFKVVTGGTVNLGNQPSGGNPPGGGNPYIPVPGPAGPTGPTGATGTGVGSPYGALYYIIDGNGSVPTPDTLRGTMQMPTNATITGWSLIADQSGSAVVDVLKSTYGLFPSNASIAGSDLPTLASVQKNENIAVSEWATSLSAGDVLQIKLVSCTTCTRLCLTIFVTVTS